MSTEYEILRLSDRFHISLDEHSNKLDIASCADVYRIDYLTRDLEPAQVLKMALEMLKVASYWMDSA